VPVWAATPPLGNITNPTLGGTTYAGTFDLALNQKNNVVPILSIGYVRPLSRRVSIMAEIGAKIGSYELVTTGSTLIRCCSPVLTPKSSRPTMTSRTLRPFPLPLWAFNSIFKRRSTRQ
jgi:hypothetical protein